MYVTQHPPANQDKEPIRVFKSDFLEFFTHGHWAAVPIIWMPVAAIFFALFYLILGVLLGASLWVLPALAGFLTGYVTNDMIHYTTHHTVMSGRALKYLKKHHVFHHFKTPNARHGVSSPWWGYAYGTLPA